MRVIKKDIDIFIDQLQKGDEGAFRVLFDEFYTALCLFAERFLGEREAAADVVQEAFLKYWDRHMDFDNYYKIKSFLYVVVRHDCLNLLRNKREDLPVTEDIAMDSDEFFHNQVMEEEAYRVFYRAIEHLPATDAERDQLRLGRIEECRYCSKNGSVRECCACL